MKFNGSLVVPASHEDNRLELRQVLLSLRPQNVNEYHNVSSS